MHITLLLSNTFHVWLSGVGVRLNGKSVDDARPRDSG